MSQIIVEINGTGTHNRGAELMAIAVSDRIRSRYPNAKIVVSPRFGSDVERARYDFMTHWEAIGSFGSLKTLIRGLAWRFKPGTVSPSKIDVVIDASGFAFSDQWGPEPAQLLTRKMSRSYRVRQALFLLPQALGPFEKPAVRDATKALFERARLVFARDTRSFAAAVKLDATGKISKCPDFTIGVQPVAAPELLLPERFVGIVPNLRMMDKTTNGADYLAFLRHAIELIEAKGLTPTFVLHDAEEDRKVIGLLGNDYERIRVLTHADPRVLKWLLGKSEFVIGSRFHALVSSLSQGVPCIGIGWSHKYPELFSDFSCSETLIGSLDDLAALSIQIERLADPAVRAATSETVASAASRLKSQVDEMWSVVTNNIDQAMVAKRKS